MWFKLDALPISFWYESPGNLSPLNNKLLYMVIVLVIMATKFSEELTLTNELRTHAKFQINQTYSFSDNHFLHPVLL